MRSLLFLMGAVALVYNEPLFIKMQREGHTAMKSSNIAPPANNAVWDSCNSIAFLKAQYDFNDQTGIDESITWRQANTINYKVNSLLLANQTGLLQVCNARTNFVGQLGINYLTCVNRYYLLSQGDTDFLNCVTYVHIYKHLEFICSVAYEAYEYNLPCIAKVQTNKKYNDCLSTFNQNITANPNALCPSVSQLTVCIQNLAESMCDVPTGWILCERERVGFAYDCPNIQCKVPGQQ